jgi:hypothetical protein
MNLLNVLAAIAERGAGFKSQADAWADTTTPHGRLMVTVLGGLAIGGVRAVADLGEDWRRAKPGNGSGGEVWPEAQADGASSRGGQGQAGRWGGSEPDRPEL